MQSLVKSSFLIHVTSITRYNNMQVNPDGSLATNQTNESNHNTAKVSTKN